jgi:hypothetical protein
MAIFNGAPPAFQSTQAAGTSVTTAAVQVYNAGSATVVTTAGTSYYAFPSSAVLQNLTLINTGTATAFLSSGTAGTPTALASWALPPGFQLTMQGTAVVSATLSNFNVWAITAAGSTSIEASLATVVAVD